jgi:hypothetical protein
VGMTFAKKCKESIFEQKCNTNKVFRIAGWEEERSGPTGKSFRFVRACVRAVIVKWK